MLPRPRTQYYKYDTVLKECLNFSTANAEKHNNLMFFYNPYTNTAERLYLNRPACLTDFNLEDRFKCLDNKFCKVRQYPKGLAGTYKNESDCRLRCGLSSIYQRPKRKQFNKNEWRRSVKQKMESIKDRIDSTDKFKISKVEPKQMHTTDTVADLTNILYGMPDIALTNLIKDFAAEPLLSDENASQYLYSGSFIWKLFKDFKLLWPNGLLKIGNEELPIVEVKVMIVSVKNESKISNQTDNISYKDMNTDLKDLAPLITNENDIINIKHRSIILIIWVKTTHLLSVEDYNGPFEKNLHNIASTTFIFIWNFGIDPRTDITNKYSSYTDD